MRVIVLSLTKKMTSTKMLKLFYFMILVAFGAETYIIFYNEKYKIFSGINIEVILIFSFFPLKRSKYFYGGLYISTYNLDVFGTFSYNILVSLL